MPLEVGECFGVTLARDEWGRPVGQVDVTTGVGAVMKASKLSFRHRLISAEAMKPSSSLNPSKVTMASCLTTP